MKITVEELYNIELFPSDSRVNRLPREFLVAASAFETSHKQGSFGDLRTSHAQNLVLSISRIEPRLPAHRLQSAVYKSLGGMV